MKTLSNFTIVLAAAICFSFSGTLFAQYKSKYPDIPIVDVHVHINGVDDVSNYYKVSEAIKEDYGANLAYYVGLLSATAEPALVDIKAAGKNRFIFAASEMRPHKGLAKTPEEIVAMVRDGLTGFKFWFGDPHRVIKEGETGITKIDDPAFDHLFSTLERNNILITSLHIADPNGPFGDRQNWMKDPVYYWGQIKAFENVVAKYPNLTIVAAHCAWIICQDAQVDYLRYMFSTYPNLYVDVSATFPYLHLLNYDNIRDFYIEYQDRILYGSDFGRFNEDGIQRTANMFADHFATLETDLPVNGGKAKGLNLPREALEKIYYKNALKLYPGLKAIMN
jgi:predicted TIM-barrel fold metal-dependent hydrolase